MLVLKSCWQEQKQLTPQPSAQVLGRTKKGVTKGVRVVWERLGWVSGRSFEGNERAVSDGRYRISSQLLNNRQWEVLLFAHYSSIQAEWTIGGSAEQ